LKDERKYTASACAKNANVATAASALHIVLPCTGRMKAKVTKSEVRSMLKMSLDTKRLGLIVAVCISVFGMSGCVESYFRIASESRLPRGLEIPPGLTRADVSATVDYYTSDKAKFILRDKNGREIGMVIGHIEGTPLHLRTPPQGHEPRYPVYVLIVINGVTEIMEHRRPEDILYVTDDPGIREELLAGRGVR
jgi:hypothetical protein